MKRSSPIGEWRTAERSSERLTLVSGPKLFPITTFATLGAVASLLLPDTTTSGTIQFAIVGAAIGAVISVSLWRAKWNRIELEPKGFAEISLGRRGEFVRWSDCAMFFRGGPSHGRWLQVGYHQYSLLAGRNPANAVPLWLLSNYGVSADRLVSIMNDFRGRAAPL